MNVFKAVKENVSARQAAEMYGLKVGRNGMACCPFHPDKTPSMKVDSRYYCFGCGAAGDVIDLTAQLLGLEPKETALRIAADFGIAIDEAPGRTEKAVSKSVANHRKAVHETKINHRKAFSRSESDPLKPEEAWILHAVKVLNDYRSLLRDFEECDAPKNMDEDWDDHPLFCLALQQKAYIDYLLDELMNCSREQFQKMKNQCGKEVEKIEKRLDRIKPGREKETG